MNTHPRQLPFLRAAAPLCAGALLLLAACASNEAAPPTEDPGAAPPPVHAELTNQFEAVAEVLAVDAGTRRVTLRREDGMLVEVVAGPAVRNFDRIAVGDQLRVDYTESLSATLQPMGTTAAPAEAAFVAEGAAPGDKPGLGAGSLVSVRVQVETIDRERDIVVFSLYTGELMARRVQTSEGRDFVAKLKVGDVVQIDYGQALAVGIKRL